VGQGGDYGHELRHTVHQSKQSEEPRESLVSTVHSRGGLTMSPKNFIYIYI